MNKLFNTELEVSLRLILLLKVSARRGLTVDRAAIVDYATIYAKSCGLADVNLNGNASYCFSEFATKRILVSRALKSMVTSGLVCAKPTNMGFIHTLSDTGKDAASKMKDMYSTAYLKFAKIALDHFKDIPDDNLMDEFNVIASRFMEKKEDE